MQEENKQGKKHASKKKIAKKDVSNEGSYWENTRKEITQDGFMEEW